ncbi:MAG: hypothetical protein JWN03_1169 [Nocardia sp.]|uniref:hypothetical protein n=1 Tax=Nocardia sp. TaxID=1821 RepID=UPI00261C5A11|nr:hypothetical protein [Nocardia sp.]MCU1640894.1 hypothetical protein [Nocardia sp.]
MADTDHLFLNRADISALQELLRRIPALAEDLAVTETKQGRVSKSGLGSVRRGRHRTALPMHLGAYEAAEFLRNSLGTWIRLVCEQRAVELPAVDNLIGAARWLNRHVYSLAMTPGAEAALDDIEAAVAECKYMIDLPPEDSIVIDPARLAAANSSILTAYQVEKIATQLGEIGKGLNRDRVRYLAKHGLKDCGRDGDTRFYRLGDVLVSHVQHKVRGKGTA